MKLRYALYDSRRDRLVSGDLYRTQNEAADHLDPRGIDVYVVPVHVPGDDPPDDLPADPLKFSIDVADIEVSFGECPSSTPMSDDDPDQNN